MSPPLIVLGAGGHAKVLIDALQQTSVPILGIVDRKKEKVGTTILGVPVLGTEDSIEAHAPISVWLVNAVGSAGSMITRRVLYETFKAKGYRFASVIHPSAISAQDVQLAEGVQIMAGAVVQAGCAIGENTIVNTGVNIDHDCAIGSHVHLAPGVILSGDARVGDSSHIGSGATIIQGIRVGKGALIAAGAVVTRDIPAGARALGVPARFVDR